MNKDIDKCRCGADSPGYHSCPYAEEICDNNDQEYCNCCSSCRYECAMDI